MLETVCTCHSSSVSFKRSNRLVRRQGRKLCKQGQLGSLDAILSMGAFNVLVSAAKFITLIFSNAGEAGGGVVLGNLRVGCSAGCFKPLPHELFTWVDRHDFVTFSILFVLVFETILLHSSEGRHIIYAVFLVRV